MGSSPVFPVYIKYIFVIEFFKLFFKFENKNFLKFFYEIFKQLNFFFFSFKINISQIKNKNFFFEYFFNLIKIYFLNNSNNIKKIGKKIIYIFSNINFYNFFFYLKAIFFNTYILIYYFLIYFFKKININFIYFFFYKKIKKKIIKKIILIIKKKNFFFLNFYFYFFFFFKYLKNNKFPFKFLLLFFLFFLNIYIYINILLIFFIKLLYFFHFFSFIFFIIFLYLKFLLKIYIFFIHIFYISKFLIKHFFYVLNHLWIFFGFFFIKIYWIMNFFFKNIYIYIFKFSYINFFSFSYIFYFFCILFSLFFKSFLSFYGIFILNLFGSFLFFISSFFNLNFFLFENKKLIFEVFKWFNFNNKEIIYFDLFIDNISFSFIFLTISIAFFVNLYLFSYFRYEPYLNRLIILINSFVLSMILLVSAGNTIVFFLGWEMIGITSYFLINFWFYRTSTLKSAMKAFTFNKFSDACIFISIILLYNIFNTFNYNEFLNLILIKNETIFNLGNNFYYFNIVSIFLLSSAFVKSAQFGFHIWLPDSMEAPVPASALIHSATLVSAGIYLVLRFYPILEFSFFSNFILIFIGSITAFLGGFVAASQTDLKKILAYSTISHCGFLIYLCSFGNFKYVLIYLFIHGLFKAISFLCIGNIIRFSKNYQDIRRMGFFYKYLPLEFFFLNVSLLNLSGLPFLFGFYSKHFLFLNNDYIYLKEIVQSLIFLSGITGIFYSFKIIYFCFFDFKKSKKNIFFEFNDDNIIKNNYFTNSGNLSSIFIFFFIIFSYFILFFFFYYLNNLNCDFTDFNIFFNKFQHFFYLNNDFNSLYNFSIFYYFSFIIILILIFINLKKKLFIFEIFELFYFF